MTVHSGERVYPRYCTFVPKECGGSGKNIWRARVWWQTSDPHVAREIANISANDEQELWKLVDRAITKDREEQSISAAA